MSCFTEQNVLWYPDQYYSMLQSSLRQQHKQKRAAELKEHEVAVKPQFVGKLPDGLKIQSVELNPRMVKVFSPPVEKKDKPLTLTTTPIYLESISENTTLYCKIIAPPAIQPADKRWPDVEVVITVAAAEEAAAK